MRPDSLLRLWRYINHLLTCLYESTANYVAQNSETAADVSAVSGGATMSASDSELQQRTVKYLIRHVISVLPTSLSMSMS